MDWVISDTLSLTVGHVVGWASAGAMVVGGVIPYIPQYRHIRKTQDAEGFSLFVCLALLVANTLRIFFWFGRRFEYPLLAQSVIMNVTMFFMIRLCVKVRNRNKGSEARYFTDFNLKYFWEWTDFQSYLDCTVLFSIVCALATYLLIDVVVFVETIGFLAVFTEAMLGSPQLVKNYKSKSTVGMSVSMVAMWTCGDIFKTVYFLLREAPRQFWMCGGLQVSVDLAILLQVYLYRGGGEGKRPGVRRGD